MCFESHRKYAFEVIIEIIVYTFYGFLPQRIPVSGKGRLTKLLNQGWIQGGWNW